MSRYHHTPEWTIARTRALERDGWRCRQCGRAGRLEVHHRESLKDGGNHAQGNLVTLCRACHLDAHRAPKTPEEIAWANLLSELMQ